MTIYPTFSSGTEELFFAKELEYWGIPNTHFEEKRLVARFPPELIQNLKSEPKSLKAEALTRWRNLGPVSLMEILRKSSNDNPIVFERKVGASDKSFNFDIFGQLVETKSGNQITGIGRANYRNILYEGQLVNDSWDGFGRAIYSDGRYHVGYWKKDRRNGYGKTYKKSKRTGEDRVQEGYWENDKLITDDVKKISDLEDDVVSEAEMWPSVPPKE
mmetsp:Transcript_12893/g.19975  ORF Transcript_12893/g.19975 Transcript_12893/m.19975 type:complete len:216 (-) Transcript_12893:20-667(-)